MIDKIKKLGAALNPAVGIATFRREKAARMAMGIGAVAATLGALAPAVHAQVTFSATAANAALVTAVDGSQDLFWDNAGNVMLIVAAVGIIVSLFYLVYRTLRRRK